MIYLDNAATTFPKPENVIPEVERCVSEYCGNPGRGGHKLAMASAQKIYECREELSSFLGVGAPERVVFTLNATYALNIAIKGLVRPGDRVIISDMEHNAVLRPVKRLADEIGVRFDVFPTHPAENSPYAVQKLIKRNTRAVICAAMPNLTSNLLPLGEIGGVCRENGIFFIVDASQAAGHVPLDMKKMNIDALCLPGHKGLYGIQGSGVLCLAENVIPETLAEGGNGVDSLKAEMSSNPPERYEAGTLPTPAIVGLLEGVREIKRRGIASVSEHEKALWLRLSENLSRDGRITVYDADKPGPVLTFNARGVSPDALGAFLSREGICVRTGFHCSALGHRTLGTSATGAVRASFGIFNTEDDVDALAFAVRSFISDK